MMMLNISMVSVAVPAMRDVFALSADMAAWIITAYALPYVIFMPLYGRLGDGLGKRRLLLIGMTIFLGGTITVLTAGNLMLLLVGRVIQGVGAASIDPLCLAIISDIFPGKEWGKAMSIWNAGAPSTAMIGFVSAGFLIDFLGWQTIFGPVLLVGLAALVLVRKRVPVSPVSAPRGFLQDFDWGGVVLFGVAFILLVFYVSSHVITGVADLADWRLLLASLTFFALFYGWERRQGDPFVAFTIFSSPNFSRASLGAALRMFTLAGTLFLAPLYLTDIRSLNATAIGFIILLHAGALMITIRLGGGLGDRWGHRPLVRLGPVIQLSTLIFLARLPQTTPLGWVILGLVGNGLGGGLTLVSLSRFALRPFSPEQSGVASGVYSMLRFSGVIFGPVIAGVALQMQLNQAGALLTAYQFVFWVMAGGALLGFLTAWGLREQSLAGPLGAQQS